MEETRATANDQTKKQENEKANAGKGQSRGPEKSSTGTGGPQSKNEQKSNAQGQSEAQNQETGTNDYDPLNYKRLSTKAHPDKGGSKYLFQLLSEAHSVLVNPVKRAHYDGLKLSRCIVCGALSNPTLSHFVVKSHFVVNDLLAKDDLLQELVTLQTPRSLSHSPTRQNWKGGGRIQRGSGQHSLYF